MILGFKEAVVGGQIAKWSLRSYLAQENHGLFLGEEFFIQKSFFKFCLQKKCEKYDAKKVEYFLWSRNRSKKKRDTKEDKNTS